MFPEGSHRGVGQVLFSLKEAGVFMARWGACAVPAPALRRAEPGKTHSGGRGPSRLSATLSDWTFQFREKQEEQWKESPVSSGLLHCSSPWESLTVPRFSSGLAPYAPVTCSLGCVCPPDQVWRGWLLGPLWHCRGHWRMGRGSGSSLCCHMYCFPQHWLLGLPCSWGSQPLLWASVQGRLLSVVPPGCGIP